jgi:predicted transposase/invertase (TIGR01784 family)
VLIGNEKILPEGSHILSIEYDRNEEIQKRDIETAKKVIFDLRVKTNHGIFIVEMQKEGSEDYKKRANFYASTAHSSQQIKEESKNSFKDYTKAAPVIVVSMIGDKIFDQEVPCISYHTTKEHKTLRNLVGSISFVYIELEKFENTKYDQSNINEDAKEWLHLFKKNDISRHYKNPQVNNAIEYAHYVQENEYDRYTRYQMSIIANEADALAAGEKIGEKQKAIQIAKKLFATGFSIDEISKITDLTLEELHEMK